MHNYQGICALLMSMALPACAGSTEMVAPKPETTPKEEVGEALIKSMPLPDNWEDLDHERWLRAVGIRKCDAPGEASEQRLKSMIDLGEGIHLLTLTCEFGAYQDAFHVYSINPAKETVSRVVLEEPKTSGASEERKLIWGALYVGDDQESLELLNLSSAAGVCGWKALYPLGSVRNGGAIAASAVYADDDCYNGVTVDDWPVLEEEKPAE